MDWPTGLALVLATYPIIYLLPAGRVTDKPLVDWAVLIVWVALLGATVVFNVVRLRGLDRRLRELDG